MFTIVLSLMLPYTLYGFLKEFIIIFIMIDERQQMTFLKKHLYDHITASGAIQFTNTKYKADIENLYSQMADLLQKDLKLHKYALGDEFTDPASQPLFWISKWVDYSDKYGFGYQLCDDGMGVMFNDTTKLIMLSNGL